MFDTIREVIANSVRNSEAGPFANQYASVIDKVAADVAAHISKCGEEVIEEATAQELDTEAVRAVLVEHGLAVERVVEPEPEPEVAETTTTSDPMTEQRLSAIEATLARLSAIAERAERSGYLRG